MYWFPVFFFFLIASAPFPLVLKLPCCFLSNALYSKIKIREWLILITFKSYSDLVFNARYFLFWIVKVKPTFIWKNKLISPSFLSASSFGGQSPSYAEHVIGFYMKTCVSALVQWLLILLCQGSSRVLPTPSWKVPLLFSPSTSFSLVWVKSSFNVFIVHKDTSYLISILSQNWMILE